MLVSPAEPRDFLTLGPYHSTVESYGVDFLWFSNDRAYGAQRKTCPDLLASFRGGDRLSRELHQMKELHKAVLIIEGSWKWRPDGTSGRMGCEGFLRSQLDGICMSLQMHGVMVLHSPSIAGTINLLPRVEAFTIRDEHVSLLRRPKPRGLWGTWRDKDSCVHLLQGFDGISYVTAAAIYDHFGGIPLGWTVTEKELLAVPGVGKVRAAKLWRALPTRTGE